MTLDAQTMPPAASSAPAALTAVPPRISSAMSCVVHHSVVATRSAINVTESVRTGRERRSILPGSPIITATSSSPSTIGTPHRGRTMRLCGSSNVRTMTETTAAAMGQRASPMTGGAAAGPAPPSPGARGAGGPPLGGSAARSWLVTSVSSWSLVAGRSTTSRAVPRSP